MNPPEEGTIRGVLHPCSEEGGGSDALVCKAVVVPVGSLEKVDHVPLR